VRDVSAFFEEKGDGGLIDSDFVGHSQTSQSKDCRIHPR
jgi:hypothetical protein